MVEVSTFSGFLEAIAGTETIVLTEDLDAQAEGYEYLDGFTVNCAIDGGNHSISNVTVQSASSNISCITFNGDVSNLDFLNLTLKCANASKHAFGGHASFTHCNFSMQFDNVREISEANFFDHCVIDITDHKTERITRLFDRTVTACDIVIRNAIVSGIDGGNLNFRRYNVGLIFDSCEITTISALSYFQNGYIAFRNCTSSGDNITIERVIGSDTSLFCCENSPPCICTNLTEVTAEQLRSESYLRSIGFIP